MCLVEQKKYLVYDQTSENEQQEFWQIQRVQDKFQMLTSIGELKAYQFENAEPNQFLNQYKKPQYLLKRQEVSFNHTKE